MHTRRVPSGLLRLALPAQLALIAGAAMTACQSGRDQAAEVDASQKGAERTAATSALPGLPNFSNAARPDSGPPLVITRDDGGLLLAVDARNGDQINALLPPYLETADGRRLHFGASALTEDSAYFIGQVTARVGDSLLPLHGTLHTSYCRAGENLCRSAKRAVRVDQ